MPALQATVKCRIAEIKARGVRPLPARTSRGRTLPGILILLLLGGCSDDPPATGAALEEEFRQLAEGFDSKTGARQITVDELKQKLQGGGSLKLLDIREETEFKVAHLEGAVLLPPSEVAGAVLAFPQDTLVVTYCTAGYRSGLAAVELERRLGRKIYSLSGGIIRWFNRGEEVVDEREQAADKIHPYSDDWKKYVTDRH